MFNQAKEKQRETIEVEDDDARLQRIRQASHRKINPFRLNYKQNVSLKNLIPAHLPLGPAWKAL
jgi:hypothetical protein